MSATENEGRGGLTPANRQDFLKKSGLVAATGFGAVTLGGLLPKAAAAATTYEIPPAPVSPPADDR